MDGLREESPHRGGARTLVSRAEGCRLRLSNKPLPYNSTETFPRNIHYSFFSLQSSVFNNTCPSPTSLLKCFLKISIIHFSVFNLQFSVTYAPPLQGVLSASRLGEINRKGFGGSKPPPYSKRCIEFVGERLAAPAAGRWLRCASRKCSFP